MFGDYVFEKSGAQYTNRVLLWDDDDLMVQTNYIATFVEKGFQIVMYSDDLAFRIQHMDKLVDANAKLAVIAYSNQYVPYDIRTELREYQVTRINLFPKLNSDRLRFLDDIGFDLLSDVYESNFDDLQSPEDTERFISKNVYSFANVSKFLRYQVDSLLEKASNAPDYKGWFFIAERKARFDLMAVQHGIDVDTQEINRIFQNYALSQFGKLSQNIDKASPVLVSKAMDYMHGHSDKFIVVVMDGMSEFDWKIISSSFTGLPYEKTSMFAMIPSTTSVSRQCLLSGKYPSQLMEPWKQSKEKTEFVNCAKNLGYSDTQIGYERGYNAQFGSFVRCGAVIINDVDDMLHAQTQGRLGMFNDITVLANQKKLLEMTQRFLAAGFDVYITADHGNTICTGIGKLMGTGVEVETKSRRMVALKDFADKTGLIEKHGLIEYPKYYLPKDYDYLICDVGDSFDAKGNDVMTHGGITLDEVVVPFIKIKAVQKNG